LSVTQAAVRRPSVFVWLMLAWWVAAVTAAFSGSVAAIAGVTAVFAVMAIAATYRHTLRWRNLMAATVLVMMFVPARRYAIGGGLPIQLDPYRLIVAVLALGWLTSLLIDPAVRWRRSGFERPLGLYVFAVVASLGLNGGRVAAASSVVTKLLIFWISFLIVVYVFPSVLRELKDIDFVCKIAVASGAVVGVFAIVESRTHYNVFDHLSTVFPFLRFGGAPIGLVDATAVSRGGAVRAYASAQHPIALGAALTLLLPLAVYLALRTGKRRWWLAGLALLLGQFASVSRTGFLMLIVCAVTFCFLRPRVVRRYWPALIPMVVLIHFAVPGTLGSIVDAFFPKGGLIAQQTNANVGSGRIATLKPTLHKEFYPQPVFGEGFATRISGDNGDNVQPNAPILDDQWAGVLVETGIVGAFAFAWLFVRSVRALSRRARTEEGPVASLSIALAASIASFGVAMFVFDAFSFIQVTFLFYLLLGLAAALLTVRTSESAERAATPARVSAGRLARPKPA
jgi:polysaccharide biosynthesis protein PslJ